MVDPLCPSVRCGGLIRMYLPGDPCWKKIIQGEVLLKSEIQFLHALISKLNKWKLIIGILVQTLNYQIKPVVTIAACMKMKLAEITLALHVVLFVMIFWRVSEERKKSRHWSQTRSMSCLLVLVPSHVVMDVSSHVIRNRVLLYFKGNKNVGELCFSSMASSAVLHCFW